MASSEKKEKRLSALDFLSGLILALFLSILVSVLIEWLMITFFRPEQGANPSREMAVLEMAYLHQDIINHVFFGYSPKEISEWIFYKVYGVPFSPENINDYYWLSSNINDSLITSVIKTIVSVAREYALVIVYISTTAIARLTILIFSIPLFLIAYLAGISDGLVERELRKFGGGTESALTYHYAKHWIVRGYFMTWFLYLAMPIHIHPVFILLPAAIGVFSFSYMASWTFKKYF